MIIGKLEHLFCVSVIKFYQNMLKDTLLKSATKEKKKEEEKKCPESWIQGEATCFKLIDEVSCYYYY